MSSSPPHKTLVPKSWSIPDIFRARLGDNVGQQRLMDEEGHFLVVLHQVPKSDDGNQRQPALFWINDKGEWRSFPESGGRSALRSLVQSYLDRIEALDDFLENSNEAYVAREIASESAPLYRGARNLSFVLKELRQKLKDDRELLSIRDLAVNAERAGEFLVHEAKSHLDFLTAQSAAEQAIQATKMAEEARTLNRLIAFFFPLATLGTLFGMNDPRPILSDPMIFNIGVVGLFLGFVVWFLVRNRGK